MGSTPAGRMALGRRARACRACGRNRGGCLQAIHCNFAAAKISLSQCFQPAEQILLARDADDLIAQLAVLEKKQRRNRANVVLG